MNLTLATVCGGLAVMLVISLARQWDAAVWRRSLVGYSLRLPTGLTVEAVTTWLGSVAALTHAPRIALLPMPPVVLEVVATADGVTYRLLVPEPAADAVLASFRAALPAVRLERVVEQPPDGGGRVFAAAGLRLAGRQRQLSVERTEVSSRALLAALQPLTASESVTWQWTLTGAGTPPPLTLPKQARSRATDLPWWLEEQAPVDSDGLRAARLKQRQPLLHVTGRLLVQADNRPVALRLFARCWGGVRLLNTPGARLVRGFLPAGVVRHQVRVRALPTFHWPLRLNAAELSGLLAFPVGESPLPGIAEGVARQVSPPVDVPSEGTVVADSSYPGLNRPLALSRTDRTMHVALLGPTGTGKSTVMVNMALSDAASGDGLAVLDPKADMALDLLSRLPKERHDDVIVINPSDSERPVGFNVLASDGTEAGREMAVDHVVHVFHEQWKEFWGPRTEAVLRAGLLVLTGTPAPDGSAFTVCELPALLTNDSFRRWAVSRPTVPASVHDFWAWFERLSAAERTQVVGPVINKLTALTQRTPLRLLLGQSTGLDLPAAIRERKLLIMPLSRGLVGAETAGLLSSLMVASLWQAILGRARISPGERRPWWLYVDEASEVVRLPIDLADVMAEARGLSVGLTIATQHASQLPTPVRNAFLGTVRSQVVFQVEPADAQLLARAFQPVLDEADLRTLPAHEVALRLCVQGQTSRPMTGKTRPLPPITNDPAELRQRSRQQYGQARADVEAGLRRRLVVPASQPEFGRRPRPGRGGRT